MHTSPPPNLRKHPGVKNAMFIPTDTTNYNDASKDVKINVLKGNPVITWSNQADIVYGTAPSSTQLSATASVPGSFVYNPAAGIVLNAGAGQTLHAAFTPTDTGNYNTASKDITINVVYNYAGFFQPVDNIPTLNTVKAGSAVPVKFSLGDNQCLNIFAQNYPLSKLIKCDSQVSIDDIEQTVTAGQSSLSYDATANQYVYVWKTLKTYPVGTCRQLDVMLIDGTTHSAQFKFK